MSDPVGTVELLAQDPTTLERDDLLSGLRSAEELRSWIAAREARFGRALDDLPRDPSDPSKDLAGTLERKQRVGPGAAKRRKQRAEQLESLPATDDALESGQITDAHADAMVKARSKADAKARAALDANESRLLALGKDDTPFEFAKRVERFVQRHSEDDGRGEWERKKARRRLSLCRDADGMTPINGISDPESAQVIRRVLDGVADELYRRDHHDHPADEPVPHLERSSEQRLHDALVEVCRRAEGTKGPVKNQDRAVVILPYADLVARLGLDANTSTLADGTPVPASVARRMACEAGLIPAVLGGPSLKLDLGRAQRIASPAQRLALKVLWETCSFADCRVPFEWTEMHHTVPFNQHGGHGKTDLAELSPVCGHCHDLAHTPGWTFAKDPHTHATATVAPDGRRWQRAPNRRRTEPPPAAAPPPGPIESPAATLFTDAA